MILSANTLLDNCHCAFINLPHRKDRLAHMISELDRVGLSANRYVAIDTTTESFFGGEPPVLHWGRHPVFHPDPQKIRKMLHRTPGAIGCHYSQVDVMKEAHAAGKHAFVMEDDLIFSSDILRRLYYIDKFLEHHDWDIFWLGGTFHVNPTVWHTGHNPNMRGSLIGRDAACTDDPRIMRTYGAFSTYAYIVNVKSIPYILDLLEAYMHESIGIDWLFIKIQPLLKTFAFVPGCVKQMDNKSDIGNGVTYFSGFEKLGPYWFQDRMEQFDPTTFDWAEAKNSNDD